MKDISEVEILKCVCKFTENLEPGKLKLSILCQLVIKYAFVCRILYESLQNILSQNITMSLNLFSHRYS